MWHSIEKIANEEELKKDEFVQFAKDSIEKGNEFKLSTRLAVIYVRTSFYLPLINKFRMHQHLRGLSSKQRVE